MTPELLCTSLKASLTFYTEVLGFNLEYERPEDGFVMLERQDSRIMLEELEPASVNAPERQWITARLERPFGRGINLQIDTDKVDELYARVQRAGAHIYLPIEERWYRAGDVELGCRQFIVQDPDGYLLRFLQNIGTRKRG